jgi:hypothetical protein
MSIRRFGRGYGIVISCNWARHNPNAKDCEEKSQTANLDTKANRAWAAKSGWGRGIRKGRKSYDLCPKHMKLERELHAKEQKEREAEKVRRDELKKAKFAGEPSPKKSRGSKSKRPTVSPSAAPAPAPAI